MVKFDKSLHLPTSAKEVKDLGWDYVDIILFSGDAYVDHPSFGIAVIARVLENGGYRVAVVPQPNWQDDLRDFRKLGAPRLFFGISAGNLDSMLNNYTGNRRKRSNDDYTPGGQGGKRPDYPTIVYTKILKKLFPDIPVIIGGIEASMRRFVHYDYWQDKILTSILELSGADLLVYGMGEKTILQIAERINHTGQVFDCYSFKQLAYLSDFDDKTENDLILHSYSQVIEDKMKYAKNFVLVESETNYISNRRIVQDLQNARLIVNPPLPPMTTEEIDEIYNLPFTYQPHPRYFNKPSIPAYEMIKHSVNIHRGCFGGCSFCTIAAHQGKFIVSRSEKSIVTEINKIKQLPDFKGHLTDLGGPSANMYKMKGIDLEKCSVCRRVSCIFPKICRNLDTSHEKLINLYEIVSKIEGIKKITIGSGVRYDIALAETGNKKTDGINKKYIELLIKNHVSGRLKVAPEHSEEKTLKLMRKTSFGYFKKLKIIFNEIEKKYNLRQQLVTYFIAAHPGCTEDEMCELAMELKELNIYPEQVQIFTPTPMTLSTVMYYTEVNPYTGKKIFVEKSKSGRDLQLKFLFWYKPEINRELVNYLIKRKKPLLAEKLKLRRK
ncbi:MAG TPA: YgiQ family radical SAM protein [Bacteroidales bacterium]|nr:YgiQ family radical SAM protein [Bacteroidales bacterium]HOL96953.1 YgiQ family radical SAM protein [Bacteroidales bacterium]HOM36466.1 YgiQ family radical SAM protein [Bacteroidales bacterium]HPD23977.1 YgiQ family radical SAM protein [Bacteroidales bacterium]HRS98510.1 YgiQ family radical SAM protein [Bacteroidales bacterium]